MTPPPVTHEEAKAIIDRLCSRAEYSPNAVERLTLAAYVEQTYLELHDWRIRADCGYGRERDLRDRIKICEQERDALKAKLEVLKEHGPHILRTLNEGYAEDRVGEECTECAAAKKALAEALK